MSGPGRRTGARYGRRVPRIDIAEQAGVGVDGRPRPTEDHVVVTANAVAVFDGATELRDGLPSGGWYASRLAARVGAHLRTTPAGSLPTLLAAAITEVTTEYGLHPRYAPASTVAMVRWNEQRIDALVLADSPLVAFTRAGPDVLADTRLADLRRSGRLRTRADADRLRNTDDGFWVAEADPGAASRALLRSWPRGDVDAIVVATDGVSAGVDEYGVLNWPGVLTLARDRGCGAVLDAVRAAEYADPDGIRWPRSKRHDDQTLVLMDFRR